MRCHDPRHRPSGSIEGMQRSKTPFGIFGGGTPKNRGGGLYESTHGKNESRKLWRHLEKAKQK